MLTPATIPAAMYTDAAPTIQETIVGTSRRRGTVGSQATGAP